MTPEEQQELIDRVGPICEQSLLSVNEVCGLAELAGLCSEYGIWSDYLTRMILDGVKQTEHFDAIMEAWKKKQKAS